MYSTVSYTKDKYEANKDADAVKASSVEFLLGMIHRF